jgi:hypothetical protein
LDVFSKAALWGLIGGFIYAGPKLSACLYAKSQTGERSGFCIVDFVVGVMTGAAASAALTPALLAQGFSWMGRPGPHQLPAIGVAVGYAFHRLGPAVLDEAISRAGLLFGKGSK